MATVSTNGTVTCWNSMPSNWVSRLSPSISTVMPVLSHLGPAAACGLTSYESQVFGADYQHNLFTCLFNLRKVTRQGTTRMRLVPTEVLCTHTAV